MGDEDPIKYLDSFRMPEGAYLGSNVLATSSEFET